MITKFIRNMMPLLVSGYALLAVSSAATADEIRMRSAVRLHDAGDSVRLRDIAELEGAAAEAHADVVVFQLSPGQAVAEIAVADVRTALNAASVHWGRTNLSGRMTVVRRQPRGDTAPLAMSGARVAVQTPRGSHGPGDPINASSLIGESTLRGHLVQWIAQQLDVPVADLRVQLKGRDKDFLATPATGMQFEFEAIKALASQRSQVRVVTWQDAMSNENRIISVRVQLLREELIASRDIPRQHKLTAADVTTQRIWVAAGDRPSSGLASALGRITSGKIKSGERIIDTRLKRETVIRRGEAVSVRCLVGGAVIRLQADAMESGEVGQTIELRRRGERTTFLAKVSAPGLALIDLGL